jgi:hypothetical protein
MHPHKYSILILVCSEAAPNMKSFLLGLGWLGSAAGLYAAVVALDLYWNILDWLPRSDLVSWGFGLLIFITLLCLALLARAGGGRALRVWSLLLCVALTLPGIFALRPEPVRHGLLGREQSSPWFYRAGRLVILSAPFVFWVLSKSRTAPKPATGTPQGFNARVPGD